MPATSWSELLLKKKSTLPHYLPSKPKKEEEPAEEKIKERTPNRKKHEFVYHLIPYSKI